MDFTGFARRIDSLGRIVIPKEIRKCLKIKPDDCLEISVENEKIILTKKNLLSGCEKSLEFLMESISKQFNTNIILTDIENVFYSKGIQGKNLLNQSLSPKINKMIFNRKCVIVENSNFMDFSNISYVLQPIIINGDVIGSVIILKKDIKLDDSDLFISKLISGLMIKNLEF